MAFRSAILVRSVFLDLGPGIAGFSGAFMVELSKLQCKSGLQLWL